MWRFARIANFVKEDHTMTNLPLLILRNSLSTVTHYDDGGHPFCLYGKGVKPEWYREAGAGTPTCALCVRLLKEASARTVRPVGNWGKP